MTGDSKKKEIIDKLVTYAKKRLTKRENKAFIEFIQLYYKNVATEDLKRRSLDALYGAANSHWELMFVRQTGEQKVRVFNPTEKEDGWETTHTVVAVILEDMPFLVDSMRMELSRLGISTHLTIHLGGLKVKRNAKHQVTDVIDRRGEIDGAIIEAPIYIEIDRQADPDILENIEDNMRRILDDVAHAVNDWEKMSNQVKKALKNIEACKGKLDEKEVEETKEFLNWLLAKHFTFLGMREYKLIDQKSDKILELVPRSSLGVLRDTSNSKSARNLSDLPPEARKLELSDQILIISQTNTRSTVHRPAFTVCIIVKSYDEKTGKRIGERRIIGLYTSDAYNSNPRSIPILKHKVEAIMERSQLSRRSHAARRLLNILETFPRDDLFQGTVEELTDIAIGILQLQDRGMIKLFVRKDSYNRYFSCLLYLPRDNANTDLIYRIQDMLDAHFDAEESWFTLYFPDSPLARAHYMLRVDSKKIVEYDVAKLEKEIIEVASSWKDSLREQLYKRHGEAESNRLYNKYVRSFPAGYREAFLPKATVHDIDVIEKLEEGRSLEMSFYRPKDSAGNYLKFKLFRKGETVPLSDALPMLENLGFRVIGEEPYEISTQKNEVVWINDFLMEYPFKEVLDINDVREIFHEAFYNIWIGDAENDGFNKLVLSAQLTWREISVLRAYAKYFRQIGFTFSQNYIEDALSNNPNVARLLVEFFIARFSPENKKHAKEAMETLKKQIEAALLDVESLDEDRILSSYIDVMMATVRTNYFQLTEAGEHKSYLSFKFDSSLVPNLPKPCPVYEIFVYAPDVEGIHLRGAKVARGGIRWSDRREDFRTEVLGLVKAQQVKNAVIVPLGAKGGFIPKRLPADGSREEVMAEAVHCYKKFISGLLDITDNYVNNKIKAPKDTVRYDDDDPYLVVAADKGTATFSDIANEISEQYDHWLGDAFASGGSAGYDHKKMGITAKGAWVSVERHFLEMDKNPDKDEFTVVGIGDMAGDVFGNGMLLSKHIKLIAAFNHMHIFIDPNPDPAKSFKERQRMFNLPRSSWEDYKKEVISKGGGVYSRKAKSIILSAQAKKALNIKKDALTPNQLIKAILKAPVDLLWNGGIGTYIKSESESHADVGDRANDVLRINGSEVQANVIGEGGNLGLTQLGRVECELAGVRLNTDFIDNSGGVDCSDREVNIKILLNDAVQARKLDQKKRNALLAKMTDEVSDLVLKDNYEQNRALSLAQHQMTNYFDLYEHYIHDLERTNMLDRAIEFMPSDEELLDRKASGKGLTRPELSVLLSYSKIILNEALLESKFVDDKCLIKLLVNNFPKPLQKLYQKLMPKHQLCREIIATRLSNDLVNDMGVTFVHQMQQESGSTPVQIARAYYIAREVFDMHGYWSEIQALDHKIDPTVQMEMMIDVMKLVRRAARWFLRNIDTFGDLTKTIDTFKSAVDELRDVVPTYMVGGSLEHLHEKEKTYLDAQVPAKLASRLARARGLGAALNITEVARRKRSKLQHVAKVYFHMMDTLGLMWFRENVNTYPLETHWDVLARSAVKSDLDSIQRRLTIAILAAKGQLNAWMEKNDCQFKRWEEILKELRSANVREYTMLTVAMRELALLVEA